MILGAAKTVCGSPFAQISMFGELPVFLGVIHMENKGKGT